MKQWITLKGNNNSNSLEGYLPLAPTGPGLFLGKSVNDGKAYVFCINCNPRDVELSVIPLTLQDFKICSPSINSANI